MTNFQKSMTESKIMVVQNFDRIFPSPQPSKNKKVIKGCEIEGLDGLIDFGHNFGLSST